jgi:NAD(P)-dependent dehydrogenase (short-subunit alcohol dehydrogenase family)
VAKDSVLLTGATSGLGAWLAPRLAEAGLRVLVHGRDPAKVSVMVDTLGADAEGFVADLAELAQCHRLAEAVAGRDDLRLLVNNAGVGVGRPEEGRQVSADGLELRWAVNYLAPVTLTRALLPTLRRNAPARIVNVCSAGQAPIDFDDVQLERDYNGIEAYRRSKLALTAWTFDLAEQVRGDGITVDCLHPATFMPTAMLAPGVEPLSTVEDGGRATLALILDQTTTGTYYDGTQPAQAHPDAYDPTVRARLRAVTDLTLRPSASGTHPSG